MLDKIRQEIKEKTHAEVPFPMTQSELKVAANNFISFLGLPQELKEKFDYSVDPNDRGSRVGYRIKKQKGGDLDDKEYFHYHLSAEKEFKELFELKNPVIDMFINSARMIFKNASSVLEDILKEFDEEFPGIHEKYFPKDQYPKFYLRFLKYNAKEGKKHLAAANYDRGGCTLALAESGPGLRIGRTETELHEVSHTDGKALFMPGLLFQELTSDEFPPAWHDVIQKSEDAYSGDASRWAIVFFADAIGQRMPTFEETHGAK